MTLRAPHAPSLTYVINGPQFPLRVLPSVWRRMLIAAAAGAPGRLAAPDTKGVAVGHRVVHVELAHVIAHS